MKQNEMCPMCGDRYSEHGWQQAEKCRNNMQIMKLEKELREHE